MTSRFRRIQEILLKARELEGEERGTWLQRQCEGDPALLREIESLLAHDVEPSPLLVTAGGIALAVAAESNLEQTSVGPYHLLEPLGEGGMGVVYRAAQKEPIEREVALKLIRWGFGSERAKLRFDAEREALSRMDHPGIARVLDAGTMSGGSPYVVMELVRGRPINEYCDEKRLSVRRRLELARDVCLAVHHAHQRGIVHRDLKPNNILVEEHDGRPVPRIIDFGIAKAVEGSLGGSGSLTVPGQLVGTPEYMSPEQVESGDRVIDTRTDIYALGVLLFELLVGSTPLGRDTLEGKSITEILHILRTFDPPPASRSLARTADADREKIADRRSSRPTTLMRTVRGDLDWVVARALERDPDQRYGSATELAAELERFLRHEPVLAGPPSRVRRIRKFVRRHRGAVASSAALAVVLTAGALTTAWQAQQAREQATRADERLEDIRRFTIDFLFELDEKLGRIDGAGEVREYLAEQTLRQLDTVAADDESGHVLEDVLAGSYRRLSRMQKELGRFDEAMTTAQTAIATWKRLLEENPGDGEVLRGLGAMHDEIHILYNHKGDRVTGVAMLEESLRYFERAVDVDPSEVSQRYLNYCRVNLAGELFSVGRVEEARELFALGIDWRRAAAREHPEDLKLQSDLSRGLRQHSGFLFDVGDSVAAWAAAEEMLRVAREVHLVDPMDRQYKAYFASALGYYGRCQALREDYEAAVEYQRQSNALFEELWADNPTYLRYANSVAAGQVGLARTYWEWGRWDEQLAAAQKAVRVADRALEASPSNAVLVERKAEALQQAALAWHEAGNLDAAETAYLDALELWAQVLPEGTRNTFRAFSAAEAKFNLALVKEDRARAKSGGTTQWSEARAWFEASLEDLDVLKEQGALLDYQAPLVDDGRDGLARCDSALAALSTR